MKIHRKTQLLLILFWVPLFLSAQEDYSIQIDGKEYPIALAKEYLIEVNGEKIPIVLTMNDILLFEDSLFSFRYPKEYKISEMVIDAGIEQIALITAEGSGLIIQKYLSMDPTTLKEMMLNELTKESINYGYEMKRENFVRKLENNKKIEGIKAILTYKDDKSFYEIASYGKKDEGIMVMTIVPDENLSTQGKKIIDLMWDSLIIKD